MADKKETSGTQAGLKRLSVVADRVTHAISNIGSSIRNKMLVAILAVALIPLAILGLVTRNTSSEALMSKAFANLEAVKANKATAIERYLYKSESDMNVLLETVKVLRQEAYDQLRSVLTIKKGQVEAYFADRLGDVRALSSNPLVLSGLEAFANAKGKVGNWEWRQLEKRHAGWFVDYVEQYGFIDLFLVSRNGRVLYTVEKESDLGQDLKRGELKNSPAGKAFRKGLKEPAVQDFEAYEPSGGVPAAFVSAPVKVNGRTRGVVMLQLPIDQINFIMQERTGLGETGETYLVGSDKLFRSDSHFVEDSTILDPTYLVDTQAMQEALAGRRGEKIMEDYRGMPVLSAYAPLDIPGLNWTILAEISVEEAFAPYVEGEVEDFFTTYKEAYGYYDLFLLNPDGYMFYSVEHEADYGTNMLTGPYRDSNLGRLITQILETKQFGIVDFERYAPAKNAPSAFVARPLVQQDQVELIVAAQLSLDHINAIMQEHEGLGETGETYLVGADKLWRSNSIFLDELGVGSTILNPKTTADTEAVKSALAGGSETKIIDNYRGNKVLSSWMPIVVQEPSKNNPQGINWALISEINLSEVRSPLTRLAWINGAVLVGAVIMVIFVALVLSGGLTNQVKQIMNVFNQIGIGNFQARAELVSKDELGRMAHSLNAMLDNTLALIQTREERDAMEGAVMKLLEEISGLAEGDLTKRAEVTADLTGAIADSFNLMAEQIGRVVEDVKKASLQVTSTSSDVSRGTESLAEMSEMQAVQVSDAIAAINEMATSIQQVADSASRSAQVSEESTLNAKEGAKAVLDTNQAMETIRERVQETARAIKRLGESSQEIGNIIQLIGDIADRTSILALNASIQAAMAGDAGRGFAVVADEVQRLAERSANATKQIETLIKNIQGEINEAGTSMDESIQRVVQGSQLAEDARQKLEDIEQVSVQLAELIESISLASKQQARASENIAKTMEEVGEISSQTSAASRQTAGSMQDMAETADRLRLSVEVFKLDEDGEEQEAGQPVEVVEEPEETASPELLSAALENGRRPPAPAE
jgi:methyl-accepting chemotaxis protein